MVPYLIRRLPYKSINYNIVKANVIVMSDGQSLTFYYIEEVPSMKATGCFHLVDIFNATYDREIRNISE